MSSVAPIPADRSRLQRTRSKEIPITISWLRDPDAASMVADFIAAHKPQVYTSYGNGMDDEPGPRVLGSDQWSLDHNENIQEIRRRIQLSPYALRLAKGPIDHFVLVAKTEHGELVGVAVITAFLLQQKYIVVEDIMVGSTLRSSAVGRNMLDWVLRAAAAAGFKNCYLEVSSSNPDAQRFFQSVGFEEKAVVMGLSLG